MCNPTSPLGRSGIRQQAHRSGVFRRLWRMRHNTGICLPLRSSSPFAASATRSKTSSPRIEGKLEEAERDLSAVAATLRIFELNGEHEQFPAHLALGRYFKRGEIVGLCKAALTTEGPLDTRELSLRVIRAKGLTKATRFSGRPSPTELFKPSRPLRSEANSPVKEKRKASAYGARL